MFQDRDTYPEVTLQSQISVWEDSFLRLCKIDLRTRNKRVGLVGQKSFEKMMTSWVKRRLMWFEGGDVCPELSSLFPLETFGIQPV